MIRDLLPEIPESAFDARAERVFEIFEILMASAGLAMFGNAVLAIVLEFGTRPAERHAGSLLATSILALIPLQSLHGRDIGRGRAISLVILAAAMFVAVRYFIYR
jgi:hypothetical protein